MNIALAVRCFILRSHPGNGTVVSRQSRKKFSEFQQGDFGRSQVARWDSIVVSSEIEPRMDSKPSRQ
jgi:hypothetical protein